MKTAPHLVHPLPFLIPTYSVGHVVRSKHVLSLALMLNNLTSFDQNRLKDRHKHLPPGHVISKEECLRRYPGVEERGLTGGAVFYDCQMYNSERLALSTIRSAVDAGADITNYTEATGFIRDKNRVTGITAIDVLTNDKLDIQAKIVINTSGPWLNRVLGFLHGYQLDPNVVLSKSFNVLLNRQLVPHYAIGVPSQGQFEDFDLTLNKGYRHFFITPWRNRSLIGTVHLSYGTDPDDSLTVSKRELQDLLDDINKGYPAAQLTLQDISFVYRGLLRCAPRDSIGCIFHDTEAPDYR